MARGARPCQRARITALPHAAPPQPQRLAERPVARGRLLRVFEHEPDLLAGVDEATASALCVQGVARAAQVPAGTWTPPAAAQPDALGLLVIDGLVTRGVTVLGRDCPELLGAGDLLRPWDPGGALPEALAGPAHWQVLTPLTIAVLDGRFARVVAAHPAIVAALLERATARARSLAFQLAVGHVRRADARLLLVLWHLAERWGRVTPAGVALGIPLTHELLAHLTGMRRPTASTALQELMRAGRLSRERRGAWLLHGEPPAAEDLSAA